MYNNLTELYNAHKSEDPDEILEHIKAFFEDCGRHFRKGLLSEEEFLLATFYDMIYIDLWGRKNNTFVERTLLLDYKKDLVDSWNEWKNTGRVCIKPWMNICIKQCGNMEKAVEWVFSVIDACGIPLSTFEGIQYDGEEGTPDIVWAVSNNSTEMILTRCCLDFSKLIREPKPEGKSLQLHFEGGLVGKIVVKEKTVDANQKYSFICEGTITDYIEKPTRIEITLERNGSLEFRFNRKITTPWKAAMWLEYDPIPHPKWGAYNVARMAAAIRRESEYKILRLPYMLGVGKTEENEQNKDLDLDKDIRIITYGKKIVSILDYQKRTNEDEQSSKATGGAIT